MPYRQKTCAENCLSVQSPIAGQPHMPCESCQKPFSSLLITYRLSKPYLGSCMSNMYASTWLNSHTRSSKWTVSIVVGCKRLDVSFSRASDFQWSFGPDLAEAGPLFLSPV